MGEAEWQAEMRRHAAPSSLEPSSQTSGARSRRPAGPSRHSPRARAARRAATKPDRAPGGDSGRRCPSWVYRQARCAWCAGRCLGAADAEIDAARKQGLDHAENSRPPCGAYSAAASRRPEPTRLLTSRRHQRDQHFRRRAGEALVAVMLGQPITRVAQPIAKLRQFDASRAQHRRPSPLADRRLVENAETQG